MAYIGIGPASFTNNLTNVQILDDIKSQFNGNKKNFDLKSNTVPFQAVSDRALMVILGGVIQAPGVDYTINGDEITFTTAPASGLTFYARNIYGLNALNAVNDGIVGPAGLTTGAPSWDSSGNTTVSGNLTVQGATTTIQSTTLDVRDKDIKLASNQSNNAGIDTAGLLWGTTAVKLKYYNNSGTNPGLNIEGTKVGINTTAPSSLLHITDGNSASTPFIHLEGANDKASIRLENTADNPDNIWDILPSIGGVSNTGFTIRDVTDSANRLVIDGSGNIGIGKNNPSAKLHVDGNVTIEGGDLKFEGNAHKISTGSSSHMLSIQGGVTNMGGLIELRGGSDTGDIRFYAQGATSTKAERMRLTADGPHLLLGGTADVNEITESSSTAGMVIGGTGFSHSGIALITSTTGVGRIYFGDNTGSNTERNRGSLNYYHSGDYMQFTTADLERLRIDSSGHMLPGADNTQDLGSGSKRIRNLHVGGVIDITGELNFTGNGHKYIDTATLNGGHSVSFRHQDGSTYETGLTLDANGAGKIFFNGSQKLATSNTGISVTGEVASSQDYPTQQAALDFNFAVTKRLDPRIRFTRSGAGSYIDENGVIKIAGSNEPRFDHDFVTGESKGLLMEEARTNMATWSNFRTLGPTANVIIGRAEGPDGVADSALAVTYTKSSASYVRTGNYAVGQNTAYTFSIWLKKVDGSPGNSFHSYTTGGAGSTIFNATGWQNTEGQDLGSMPSGVWKKFEMTKTTISGATAIDFVLPGYDQVDTTIHYYGIQLESGSCATSYIPCHYGAATSRNADRAWIDGEDFTDVYNTTEGTFICRTSTDDITVANQWAWGVEKSTNRGGFFNGVGYRVGGGGSGYAGGWYNNNGATSAFVNMNASITKGTPFTVGFAYKLNDMAGSTNGSTPSSDTSATIAADGEFDRFSLGSYHYDDFERGHIQRVMYYPKRVTNNQLQLLTS